MNTAKEAFFLHKNQSFWNVSESFGKDRSENVMEQYLVKPVEKPVEIEVEVPGSKSITNRALLMAAMAEGESVLRGVLFSDDSKYFLQALQDLGFPVEIEEKKSCVRIAGQGGRIPKKRARVYVGSAGTAARFLTAFLAMGDGVYEVDSSEQMKKRPMKELLQALESLGARISYEEEEYTFPMKITGIGAATVEQNPQIALNIDRSSQFLSALLMVSPLRFPSLTIQLTGKRSARSYVEMTEQMMQQFGHSGVVRKEENCYEVSCGAYQAQDYRIEPDVSAACYFYAMAAVTGGRAVVRYMRQDSLQGDMKFIAVLEQMGCTVAWTGGQLLLTGPKDGRLHGVTAVFSDFSDQALTMAAIAPYADSPVTIKGIAHIRAQESDRVAVMCSELAKLGITCRETADSVTIYPGALHGAEIETYDDHRAAMAFAITGLRTPNVVICNPSCCKKTFPEFFTVLEQLYH
jgi:3-phosphoshikimate 1-carboxyvinyltransferase